MELHQTEKFYFSFRDFKILLILREKEKEGEREGDKH